MEKNAFFSAGEKSYEIIGEKRECQSTWFEWMQRRNSLLVELELKATDFCGSAKVQMKASEEPERSPLEIEQMGTTI